MLKRLCFLFEINQASDLRYLCCTSFMWMCFFFFFALFIFIQQDFVFHSPSTVLWILNVKLIKQTVRFAYKVCIQLSWMRAIKLHVHWRDRDKRIDKRCGKSAHKLSTIWKWKWFLCCLKFHLNNAIIKIHKHFCRRTENIIF